MSNSPCSCQSRGTGQCVCKKIASYEVTCEESCEKKHECKDREKCKVAVWKCRPEAVKPDCDIGGPDCDTGKSRSSEEVACRYRAAIVNIHSEIILTNDLEPSTVPVSRVDRFLNGNGFFIIVGGCRYVLCPASLVLIPPTYLQNAQRYPYVTGFAAPTGFIPNITTRVSRILVDVFNVNGWGASYGYEAQLVGVDGAGDIAILRIDHGTEYNRFNPKIKDEHPHLKWGSSSKARVGERAYSLGDFGTSIGDQRRTTAASIFTGGYLADNKHGDYLGLALQEQVVVNWDVYAFKVGLPILNKKGRVIGMQTQNVIGVLPPLVVAPPSDPPFIQIINEPIGNGLVAGPSEFFMRRVVKALTGGVHGKYGGHLSTVNDSLGNYFLYNKFYAGLAYDIVTGLTYDTVQDYGSIVSEPQVRLNETTGAFLNSPVCKELIGIRVLAVAGGLESGRYTVPGAEFPVTGPPLPNSPFLGSLNPGDIITHIGGCPLGDLVKQIVPALRTWTLKPNKKGLVELTIRRGGQLGNVENYEFTTPLIGTLTSFPGAFDYPWYALSVFPLTPPPFAPSFNPPLPVPNFRPPF